MSTARSCEPAHRAICKLRAFCIAAVLVHVLGCAASKASAPRAVVNGTSIEPSTPELRRAALAQYVPAAGLRWMLVGSPKALLSALSPDIHQLLPTSRLAAFRRSSGIDLSEMSEGLVAGFDAATLYMFPFKGNSEAFLRFSRRVTSGGSIQKPHPRLTLVSGEVGKSRQTLLQLDDRLFAVSVGEATPARVVELYAQNRLESATALDGVALSSLPPEAHQCTARLYAPGPLKDWQEATGILGAVSALSVCVDVVGDDVRTQVYIQGQWPPDGEQGVSNLYQELSQGGLGSLLGLNEPYSVSRRGQLIIIATTFNKARLISGVYAAVRGNVDDLFRLPGDRDVKVTPE